MLLEFVKSRITCRYLRLKFHYFSFHVQRRVYFSCSKKRHVSPLKTHRSFCIFITRTNKMPQGSFQLPALLINSLLQLQTKQNEKEILDHVAFVVSLCCKKYLEGNCMLHVCRNCRRFSSFLLGVSADFHFALAFSR